MQPHLQDLLQPLKRADGQGIGFAPELCQRLLIDINHQRRAVIDQFLHLLQINRQGLRGQHCQVSGQAMKALYQAYGCGIDIALHQHVSQCHKPKTTGLVRKRLGYPEHRTASIKVRILILQQALEELGNHALKGGA